VTIQLALLTLAISLTVSIPLGIMAALHQDRPLDYAIRSVSILGLAMPNFWLALLVILGLAMIFTWGPPVIYRNFWQSPSTNFQIMIWPALVVSWGFSSYLIRVTRSTMLEVLRQDYIRTALSKGLEGRTVVTRHALRNALIPVVTLIGTHIDVLLGGSVILENVFGVPGVGQGIVDGASMRDYPVILSLAMILVFIALLVNLLVDLAYVLIDPRISYR
jgi:peptide/nickel transport system permease protein